MTELYINGYFFPVGRSIGKLGIVGAVSVQGQPAPVLLETLLGDIREPVGSHPEKVPDTDIIEASRWEVRLSLSVHTHPMLACSCVCLHMHSFMCLLMFLLLCLTTESL